MTSYANKKINLSSQNWYSLSQIYFVLRITLPDIFFYLDYIPRTDLLTDLDYLERYYEPVNQLFLNLQEEPSLSMYTSKSVYIRQFMSPIGLCYTSPATNDTVNLLRTFANEMLERWINWVEEAEPVPEDIRTALAEGDLFLRRSSAERDPGNKLAEQMFCLVKN